MLCAGDTKDNASLSTTSKEFMNIMENIDPTKKI